MTGRGDLLLAFAAATAVHAGAFSVGLSPEGGGGAGDGGSNRMSIEAALPSISALVRNWETKPEVSEPVALNSPLPETKSPVALAQDAGPARMTSPVGLDEVVVPDRPLAAETAAPLRPSAAQEHAETPIVASIEALPQKPSTPRLNLPKDLRRDLDPQTVPPIADLAPRLAERPLPRPAETDAPAVARQVASGVGDAGLRGSARSAAPKLSDAERQAAASAWAADIQRRIARHHAYPRDSRDEGRVRVGMVILSSGKLSAVSVVQSSGSASLDKAALQAVKRAAPFPPAPADLNDEFFNVGQWISFKQR